MPLLSSPRRGFSAVIAALLVASTLAIAGNTASPAPAAAATAVSLTVDEQAHLNRLNAYRRDRGLPALSVDARVQADARQWARSMRDSGRLAHDPTLRDDCFAASSTCTGWAENVGVAGDQGRVFEMFSSSPGHAQNMATNPGSTVRVGIAALRSGQQTWVVQRFMRCECQNDGLASQLNRDRSHAIAFAKAVHEDFLNTSGSAASLDVVAAPLAYGVDRRAVVERLAYSDTWVGAMVDRFYRLTLGRTPDAHGRAFWINMIRSGRSPAEVAAHFFASDEYFHAVGGTRKEWIRKLYDQLLGRSGDASGVEHWVWRMQQGTSREAVAVEFYQSVESRRVRVQSLYDLLLARNPDDKGLIYWIFRLADGQDVRLAVDLAGAEEYLYRAIQRFG